MKYKALTWFFGYPGSSLRLIEWHGLFGWISHAFIEAGHQKSNTLSTKQQWKKWALTWLSSQTVCSVGCLGQPFAAAHPCCSQTYWEHAGRECCRWSHWDGVGADHSEEQMPKLFQNTPIKGQRKEHCCLPLRLWKWDHRIIISLISN